MTKEIWKNGVVELTRENVWYNVRTTSTDADGNASISRDELRELYAAIKVELGIAGG